MVGSGVNYAAGALFSEDVLPAIRSHNNYVVSSLAERISGTLPPCKTLACFAWILFCCGCCIASFLPSATSRYAAIAPHPRPRPASGAREKLS